MEKFTKGPWQIKDDWMIVDSEERLIVKFEPQSYGISSNGLPESFFNAALIAAAPEMYEMLDNLRLVLTATNMTPAAKGIEKLLAKARGEHDN